MEDYYERQITYLTAQQKEGVKSSIVSPVYIIMLKVLFMSAVALQKTEYFILIKYFI